MRRAWIGVVCPRRLDRGEFDCRRSEFRHAGIDQQIALINAPELLGAGVDVDELLLWAWNVDQRVIDRRPFSQAWADREQQVRIADAAFERWIQPTAISPT